MAFDEETAEPARKLLTERRDVVEKKLMGGLCFMVKGGMCCSVSGKGAFWFALAPTRMSGCFARRTCRRWKWADG
jgi:hypothetical protein